MVACLKVDEKTRKSEENEGKTWENLQSEIQKKFPKLKKVIPQTNRHPMGTGMVCRDVLLGADTVQVWYMGSVRRYVVPVHRTHCTSC